MNIKKPVFIIGSGRCGSTILHKIFSYHPNVAYLSRIVNYFPQHPEYNKLLMKLIDVPFIGTEIQEKIKPNECYKFWDYHYGGFGRAIRDLKSFDVTPKVKTKVKNNFKKVLTKKRNRLLIKITGWSRIGFLKEIFPNAKFIHVLRDGRAVANSLVNVQFWEGWKGPNNWRLGKLPSKYKAEWERFDKDFVMLAGIYWKIIMDSIIKSKNEYNVDFLEIKYEDLCCKPVEIFEKVISFSELEWDCHFKQDIKKFKLKNSNYKWKENLTKDQQKNLNIILETHLKKFDYLKV